MSLLTPDRADDQLEVGQLSMSHMIPDSIHKKMLSLFRNALGGVVVIGGLVSCTPFEAQPKFAANDVPAATDPKMFVAPPPSRAPSLDGTRLSELAAPSRFVNGTNLQHGRPSSSKKDHQDVIDPAQFQDKDKDKKPDTKNSGTFSTGGDIVDPWATSGTKKKK